MVAVEPGIKAHAREVFRQRLPGNLDKTPIAIAMSKRPNVPSASYSALNQKDARLAARSVGAVRGSSARVHWTRSFPVGPSGLRKKPGCVSELVGRCREALLGPHGDDRRDREDDEQNLAQQQSRNGQRGAQHV